MPYTNSFDARLRPNRSVYRARPLRRACAPESRTHAASDVRRIPSRSLPQLAVVLALLIALGGACWYAVSTLTGLVDGARASGSLSTGPQSTPKSAWKAGEVPCTSAILHGLTEPTQKTTSEPPVAGLRAWPWRTWR